MVGLDIVYGCRCTALCCDLVLLLGRLCVTNPPIRLMCPMSGRPSTFSFPDSNLKMLSPIEFIRDREIDHRHS